MWDSWTPDYFDVVEVKPVTSWSGENSEAYFSASQTTFIEIENESDGSSGPNLSKINETLEKHGERIDKILELVQTQTTMGNHQGTTLTNHSEALASHGQALTSQGQALAKHAEALANQAKQLAEQGQQLTRQGEAIVQVVKDQEKIQVDVVRIAEKLDMVEGLVEELRQGGNPGSDGGYNYNTRSKGKRSSSRGNTKVQRSLSSITKNERVRCNFCQKDLKRTYIAQHKRMWCHGV